MMGDKNGGKMKKDIGMEINQLLSTLVWSKNGGKME
jgi:hypothetical protein